ADPIAIDVIGNPAAVEVAIFEAKVEMGPHRRTNASDQLPGKVAVLGHGPTGSAVQLKGQGFPGDTGTTADVEVRRFLVAEVEQQVGHRRIDAGPAGRADVGRAEGVFVKLATLVA